MKNMKNYIFIMLLVMIGGDVQGGKPNPSYRRMDKDCKRERVLLEKKQKLDEEARAKQKRLAEARKEAEEDKTLKPSTVADDASDKKFVSVHNWDDLPEQIGALVDQSSKTPEDAILKTSKDDVPDSWEDIA